MNTIEQQRELEATLITTFDAEIVAFHPSGGAAGPPACEATPVPNVPPEQTELFT